MTSQGTAHGRFRRAIQRRNFLAAETATRELGTLTLADALDLTLLAAEVGDKRWQRLAARWHARFVLETQGIGVAESLLALAAAQALGGKLRDLAAHTLRQLAQR
jgi:hypothetical protein